MTTRRTPTSSSPTRRNRRGSPTSATTPCPRAWHWSSTGSNSAELDDAGSRAAAHTINGLLSSRDCTSSADRARLPLAAERIVGPLFATGEPRSGTTLLHALLAEDEDSRALRFWEVMYPSPPPGPAADDDPRRAQADADWREILDRIPPWIVSHPYNDLLGDGLPECERTWAFDFRAMNAERLVAGSDDHAPDTSRRTLTRSTRCTG